MQKTAYELRISDWSSDVCSSDLFWIFAVTLGALILALALYMRNVVGIVTPIVTSLVAAVWGFGFVGWLKSPIEPLLMIVPLLLVARSFSHCVQFTDRYYAIFAHVGDRVKAAEKIGNAAGRERVCQYV